MVLNRFVHLLTNLSCVLSAMVCALFLIAVSHTLEFVVWLQVRIFLVWNYQRSKFTTVVVDGVYF